MSTRVTHELLLTAPWKLPGIEPRCGRLLQSVASDHTRWAPCCRGMPPPLTLVDLLAWRPAQLLSFPGFGKETLINVRKVLADHGCELARRTAAETLEV